MNDFQKELPEGWTTVNLDELVDAIGTSGKKVKTKDANDTGRFPVIDQGVSVRAGYLDDEDLVISASEKNPVLLFGDHTRVVKFILQDFIPGADGTKLMRAKSGAESRYLYYLLLAAKVPDRGYGRHYQYLKQLDFPVAPRTEQTRIADKLDTVLTRVDACRDRLARVAPLLKRFRQSVLAAATSGRLTEDWRRALGVSDGSLFGWKMVSVESLKADQPFSLAIGPFGSDLKVSDYKDSGVPLVFVRDIRSKFCEDPVRYVSPAKAVDLRAHTVEGGDILITKMGDPPGDVAIYPARRQSAVITADCIKLRVNAKLACTEYVAYVIDSPGFRDRLRAITAGVAQQKISLTRLRDFELPLAPMQEQTEIVRRVETLFAFADRLEARLKTAQTAADRLTPALLAKAFRGELVPQDPNDEPAAELLKRLAASRDAAPKAKRGRRSATN